MPKSKQSDDIEKRNSIEAFVKELDDTVGAAFI